MENLDSLGTMEEPPEKPEKPSVSSTRRIRCMDWLEKQNNLEPKKLSLQNKNDIQFIIQTNADRKKFLLAAAEDMASVCPGVGECEAKPVPVALCKLRVKDLRLECEWPACRGLFSDYTAFQKHVQDHVSDVHVSDKNGVAIYTCLWDVCGFKTEDSMEILRHINYHSYHTRLLAIGFNGRATLQLARCKKDSTKRNQLPQLKSDHCCMWTGCEMKFYAMQTFLDHVKQHVLYSDGFLCSWAGCGARFPRRMSLAIHVRAHTGERLIACYHCGAHFACNRKLCDHLRRQNVYPNSSFTCAVCGAGHATAYLLRAHARQHVSAVACALCDMSAPGPAALAQHVRYRHFGGADRPYACGECEYKAVTKADLRKHIHVHLKRKKKLRKIKKENGSGSENMSEDSDSEPKQKEKSTKKYACHMCPSKEMKIFSRGSRLTTHLVKVHGAQWPSGHSRFRYQISEDGMYRLTTTRYEFLEVSEKIVDGYSGPQQTITNTFEFDLVHKAEPTESTPRRYEVILKDKVKSEKEVEITMCDEDEHGNIIVSEIIKSDVVYT